MCHVRSFAKGRETEIGADEQHQLTAYYASVRQTHAHVRRASKSSYTFSDSSGVIAAVSPWGWSGHGRKGDADAQMDGRAQRKGSKGSKGWDSKGAGREE